MCIRDRIAGLPPSAADLRRVEALGMTGAVVFTGLLRDVRPLLAAMDVGFVLSSRLETISFACREMMAAGRPVIVSDTGGLAENVTEGGKDVYKRQARPSARRRCARRSGRRRLGPTALRPFRRRYGRA